MKNKVSGLFLGLILVSLPGIGQSLVMRDKTTSAVDRLYTLWDFTHFTKNIPFSLIIKESNFTGVNHAGDETEWTIINNFSFGKDRGNTPMIADLNALHPFFRDKITELIYRCHKKGIELAIVESYRTRAKQAEYFSMGKKYTRSAGGKSKHQYGLAVDLVPIVKGEPMWDNKILWKKIGMIGESLGLRWGGRWRSIYDPAHFEWTGGLSGSHLANGIYPLMPNYPCLEEDIEQLKKEWAKLEEDQSVFIQALKNSETDDSDTN